MRLSSDCLTDEYRPRLRPDVRLRLLEHEAVILLPDGDQACVLNPPATAVLTLCDGSRTVSELIAEITRRYLGHASTISQHVQDCLRQFCSLSLLQ